jgi:multidrug efflux pump subunit AcrB
MWIVRLALRRPYTFVVAALVILIMGPFVILRTPTDIFPNIDIPVVSVLWQYTGLSAEEMSARIVSIHERILTTTVDNIEHIESQSLNGIAVEKIFFHQGANVNTSLAQVTSVSQTILKFLPPGATPPLMINYTASSVPVRASRNSNSSISERISFASSWPPWRARRFRIRTAASSGK